MINSYFIRRFPAHSRCINTIQVQIPRMFQTSVARRSGAKKFTFDLNNEKKIFRESQAAFIETVAKKSKYSDIAQWSNGMPKLLDYLLSGGKLGRSMTVMSSYKAAENPKNMTEESLKRAQILGWCVELHNASIIVFDDLMDESPTRRGKPTWHTFPDVGVTGGIKDAVLLLTMIYDILEANFSKHQYYDGMVDLVHQSLLKTYVGELMSQEMDTRTKSTNNPVSVEEYYNMTMLKTGYCTYQLPMLFGYLLANKGDEKLLGKLTDICRDFGKLYQIENDALDCFGDETITGKKGNDIEESKCTWWFVNAYKLSNAEQRALLVSNYGHNDPARVHTVKQLYKQLNLPQIYEETEKAVCDGIKKKANALGDRDRDLVLHVLSTIYRRNK